MGKLYRSVLTSIAKCIFRKPEFEYEEPLPEGEPVVFTANHSAAEGPVISTLYYPAPLRPWTIAQILDKSTAAGFVFYDFFAGAIKKCQSFWRGLSHMVASFLRPLLLEVGGIPVYHDKRITETLNNTLAALERGTNIIVFPECPTKFSDYINDFYGGFAKLGELYFKNTGKCLKFYPTYIANSIRKVMVGKPVEYEPDVLGTMQRKRIAETLRDRTELLAEKLPPHKVTPFLTEDWYKAYGHYWEENRMLEYWNLSKTEFNKHAKA